MSLGLAKFALATALFATPVWSASIVVTVTGIQNNVGNVRCALFSASAAKEFPFNTSRALVRRLPAQQGEMRCEFADLSAGTYAVAATQDRNKNDWLDRSGVGRPTEPWAVSNNIRPSFRPALFRESSVTLVEGETKLIELQLVQ
jgi:uncharacterized protein (DUF2141 family)